MVSLSTTTQNVNYTVLMADFIANNELIISVDASGV
jgi:hypothetical protein